MKPEIFMDDFERTTWGDSVYSIIGRALTFSARFERMCRTLNALLHVKNNILESEEGVTELVSKIWKQQLVQHVSSIATEPELKEILNKGRRARNEIAHELTLGLDCSIDTLPRSHIDDLMDRLRELVTELAEADQVVSLISSVATNEHLPSPDFLAQYPSLIVKWVIETEEIKCNS